MIATATSDVTSALRRDELTARDRDEMFALLAGHFEGVSRPQFDADLAEKNWAIQIRRDGRLVGFSTLLACESVFAGAAITAIYSGDTIVAPEAWGTPALARGWIATVNAIRSANADRRCFWLLLTSGFRTYRFLPVFWREFFPRFDAATPDTAARLMQQLARERYGELYNATTGLVRFPRPQRLRDRLAGIPPGREVNPHVAFFLSSNPRHAEGDELVCLTEIADSNLTAAGRRMIAAGPE